MWDIEGAIHYAETCGVCNHQNIYLLKDVKSVTIALHQTEKFFITCNYCNTPITIDKPTLYVEDNRDKPGQDTCTLQR